MRENGLLCRIQTQKRLILVAKTGNRIKKSASIHGVVSNYVKNTEYIGQNQPKPTSFETFNDFL